mgnify:CR=1 FL=1
MDAQLELKSTMAKKDRSNDSRIADNMKLSLWGAMQGIKDEQLLVSILSRVMAKESSLEEMVTEYKKEALSFYLLVKCWRSNVLISPIDFQSQGVHENPRKS